MTTEKLQTFLWDRFMKNINFELLLSSSDFSENRKKIEVLNFNVDIYRPELSTPNPDI